MLRNRATETEFSKKLGLSLCFALSFYMSHWIKQVLVQSVQWKVLFELIGEDPMVPKDSVSTSVSGLLQERNLELITMIMH